MGIIHAWIDSEHKIYADSVNTNLITLILALEISLSSLCQYWQFVSSSINRFLIRFAAASQ